MLVDGVTFIFSNLLNVSQMDFSNVFSNGLVIADFTVDQKAFHLELQKICWMLLMNIKVINIFLCNGHMSPKF
jgi:hypothetical protein